jgi:hypothetical protein
LIDHAGAGGQLTGYLGVICVPGDHFYAIRHIGISAAIDHAYHFAASYQRVHDGQAQWAGSKNYVELVMSCDHVLASSNQMKMMFLEKERAELTSVALNF